MQLYNYEDIINKQPIYHLCKKKYFMKSLYSNSFIRLVKAYKDLAQKTFIFSRKPCSLSVMFIRRL